MYEPLAGTRQAGCFQNIAGPGLRPESPGPGRRANLGNSWQACIVALAQQGRDQSASAVLPPKA